MHFDRYGDVSRIIYANLKSSKSHPEFSLLPEIEEEGSFNSLTPVATKSSSASDIGPVVKPAVVVAEEKKVPSNKSGTLNYLKEEKILREEEEEKGRERKEINTQKEEEERRRKKNLKNKEEEEVTKGHTEVSQRKSEERGVGGGRSVSSKQPQTFDDIVAAVSAEYDRKEAEMKDLDRLVNDLLLEASQIPDIPYHARPDGGPFRYCPEGEIVGRRKPSSSSSPSFSSSPFQPTSSSTPKSTTSRVAEVKSSWPDIKVEEPAEYFPKNWSKNNQQDNSSKNWSTVGTANSLSPGAEEWSKVTVEHEPSPKNWTRIPVYNYNNGSSNSNNDNNKTSRHDPQQGFDIPILRSSSQRTSRRDQWENSGGDGPHSAREYTARDWEVFQQVQDKERELENWVRGGTTPPKRQPVKYSRSVSADQFSDHNSDDWLAKQMAKLQLKRSGSIRQTNPLRNHPAEVPSGTPAWLLELKQRNSAMKTSSVLSSNDSSRSNTTKEIPVQLISSNTSSIQPSVHRQRIAATEVASPVEITPRFPACPPTPYMNKSAALRRTESSRVHRQLDNNKMYVSPHSAPVTDEDTEDDEEEIAKIMFSNRRQEEDDLKFTVDTSCNWYKPNASREEAINALAHRFPGTFIIRNSNSFPGAYGLALKVDDYNVRHFLIEPTRAGVRLRGSTIEPVFGSLSALVYAHTIQPLALPVKLRLHAEDNLIPTSLSQSTTSKLLSQGAACQLLFLGSNNVEMLTGTEAIQRSVSRVITNRPTLVNLRLSKSGLVLTDVMRESFFRNHHPLSSIIHAGIDPLNRTITLHGKLCKLFGIVVTSSKHNSVLVLSEYEEGQPAVAIVSFILRVIQWRSL